MSGQQPKQLIRLTQAQLDEVVRRHALFHNGRSGGRRATLFDHDLSRLTLANADMSHAEFTGSSFYGADVHGTRFDSSTLFACDFRQANLENASMARADLRGCFFAGAVLVGANLFEADLRPGTQISRDKAGEFHVMLPTDKPGEVSATAFIGANLTNASLMGVDAVQTDFSEAEMRGCKLVRAHVRGANFTGSNLEGADFGQADTRDTCFRGAVIIGANFDYADLAGADLRDALSDKPNGRLLVELDTSLEELLRLHRVFIDSCGVEGAALDLSGFDLRGAGSLTGACLTMLTAPRAIFYGLDLSKAALQAAHCDNADFRGCRFDGADMRGIGLQGAMLAGASMRGVNLCTLRINDARGMPADMTAANLRHADMRGARLQGACLGGADMSFADVTEADMTGVDLNGAKLAGCKLSGQQLDAALHVAGAMLA